MNERILSPQLLKLVQAAGPEHSSANPQWVKNFTELIVRECINIACEYDKPKLSGPGQVIASYIESHFDIYIGEDGRFVK